MAATPDDSFLIAMLGHLVVRKPLIQQSYGIYRSDEHATEHRFPREPKTLSPAASDSSS